MSDDNGLELHKREDDDSETQFAHKRETDSWWRKWRPLIAYLFLVAAIIWTINDVRVEGTERRVALGQSAKLVVKAGCERDNSTREILRGLIAESDKALRQYREEGLLTEEQTVRAMEQNREATKKLADVDCEAAAARLVVESD